MDYSTISNKTNFTETEELTGGELNERYYLLKKQYDILLSNYESTKQELHDTRRSYQTALDVQSHLTVELESYQAEEEKRRNDLNSRITLLQEEISLLREDRLETVERHTNEIKKLQEEKKILKEERILARNTPEQDNTELEEVRAALVSATSDTNEMKTALEDARAEIGSWRMKVEELVNEIGEMRAAAEIRREELKAAVEREAAALADLTETRALLHQADSQEVQPHAAKGNSIFAEVEDKRQEMAKNLIQMKQTNSRLRRDLANKQAELDALLHEKQTIWELQAGNTAHYDRELMDSYEERISQLEALCERQRRELARWFGKLNESAEHGWLAGVLEHFKSECEKLRAEVLFQGAAQLASAAQVRELRRKMAQMTIAGIKQSPQPQHVDKDESTVHKYVAIKNRPTPDDIKKKVSFN